MKVEPECARTTMNVAQWLNAIDLAQYEVLFREHEIDEGILSELVEAGPRKDWRALGAPQASPQGDRCSRDRGNRRQGAESRSWIVACGRRA